MVVDTTYACARVCVCPSRSYDSAVAKFRPAEIVRVSSSIFSNACLISSAVITECNIRTSIAAVVSSLVRKHESCKVAMSNSAPASRHERRATCTHTHARTHTRYTHVCIYVYTHIHTHVHDCINTHTPQKINY